MVDLGVTLTMWLRAFVDPTVGTGAVIGGSDNDERINLRLGHQPSTEEIADEIVTQGSCGMWTLKTGTSPNPPVSTVDFSVEPYQHYTNIARKNKSAK